MRIEPSPTDADQSAVRQLYTDQDEVLFDATRPVILNGIDYIVTRPDLADRAVFLALEPIPEERRRPEAELWTAFEAERPHILGALLDAVVEGLKRLPDTRLPKLPRMADFALWATACETALWPADTFWSAYCDNRDEAVEGVIAIWSTSRSWTHSTHSPAMAVCSGSVSKPTRSASPTSSIPISVYQSRALIPCRISLKPCTIIF